MEYSLRVSSVTDRLPGEVYVYEPAMVVYPKTLAEGMTWDRDDRSWWLQLTLSSEVVGRAASPPRRDVTTPC